MNNDIKAINKAVNESMIDWTRVDLDPLIFDKIDNQYVMKPRIVSFLKGIVGEINRDIIRVDNCLVKGSILSFQWLDNTDVDLLVEISEIDDDNWRRVQDEIDSRFGMEVPGTEHPLQIYALRGEYDATNADGIYHLDGDCGGWIKGPYNLRVNIKEYMPKFEKVAASIDVKTGQLKRDLIDYELMSALPKSEVVGLETELQGKLDNIDDSVNNLVDQYKHIKDMRHHVFERDMTPEEITQYGSKNALPENVVYKMLERYYYTKFLYELKKITSDENDIDGSKVKEIESIIMQGNRS